MYRKYEYECIKHAQSVWSQNYSKYLAIILKKPEKVCWLLLLISHKASNIFMDFSINNKLIAWERCWLWNYESRGHYTAQGCIFKRAKYLLCDIWMFILFVPHLYVRQGQLKSSENFTFRMHKNQNKNWQWTVDHWTLTVKFNRIISSLKW